MNGSWRDVEAFSILDFTELVVQDVIQGSSILVQRMTIISFIPSISPFQRCDTPPTHHLKPLPLPQVIMQWRHRHTLPPLSRPLAIMLDDLAHGLARLGEEIL